MIFFAIGKCFDDGQLELASTMTLPKEGTISSFQRIAAPFGRLIIRNFKVIITTNRKLPGDYS
jgi:hypothetical protein